MSYGLRKKLKRRIVSISTWTTILLFGFFVLQPHKFQSSYERNNQDFVQAAYSSLLEAANTQDGSIQFETMLVGEDGEQNIVYVVQPGDTLSDIAQNFGTTISAISQANKLGSQQVIRPGQRLTIAYNEGIIYDLTQSTTLAEFANKYDLNTQDLMTLNYIQDEDQLLEPGQQLFLDLNKIEAESRGLIQKKKHEMLEFDSELKQQISDNQAGQSQSAQSAPTDSQQVIIGPEETDQQLQEEVSEPEPQPEPQDSSLCADSQCERKGKCFTKPDNASCTPDDPENARLCNDGFEEKGKSCVALPEPEPQPEPEPVQPQITAPEQEQPVLTNPSEGVQPREATAPKKSEEVLTQWYFNPLKSGAPVGSRGAGHCTQYAAYYWRKHYGVNLRDYLRGNAGQRYTNAQAAGMTVGQTPQLGAIIVMKFGNSGRRSYGHAGIVIDIDRSTRQVKIQDMNFLGRFIVSEHRVDMDSLQNPVIGYIYPPSE